MKSCFFIGHREAPEQVLPALIEAVEKHIVDYSVKEFYVGSYGGFDHLAAKAVIAAKSLHPEIRLMLLLPYHPAERPVKIPTGFDGAFYPPHMESVPRRYAIVRANTHMIDTCDYLISYVWHPASNARNLLEHAILREQKGSLSITNLASQH